MKNMMKKIASAIIAFMLISTFTLSSFASEAHTHEFDMNDWDEYVDLICRECGLLIRVDPENPTCAHEYVDFVNPDFHGIACTMCNYKTGNRHIFEDLGIEGKSHNLVCQECNYAISHPATEWVDEIGHHVSCDLCLHEETTYHVPGISMTTVLQNSIFHKSECDECGYVISNTHTFIDGECICGYTTDEAPKNGTIVYGIVLNFYKMDKSRYMDLLVNGETITYEMTFSYAPFSEGSFVEATVNDDKVVNLGTLADFEITNDLNNFSNYVYHSMASRYKDSKKYDIRVRTVTKFNHSIDIEFYGGEDVTLKNPIIYDMESRETIDELEKGDCALYFTSSLSENDIIIVIG